MYYTRIRFRSLTSKDKGHCNLPNDWSEEEIQTLIQKLKSQGYVIIQRSVEYDEELPFDEKYLIK